MHDPTAITLKKIYWLAQEIQSEIETFQPELLLVLAHGGFAPLWALQALWKETNETSTPPILITNIGREKLTRYEYHRQKIGMNFMADFEPFDYFEPFERGYFLVWLEQQVDWRTELRQQIKACLGSDHAPTRILVIDDTVYRRYTTVVALGLLLAEYPDTEARMIAADLPDWRVELATPWLEENNRGATEATKYEIKSCLFHFATGTSDVHPNSLYWEPLQAESYVMQENLKHLPAETWIGLGSWMEERIKSFVRQYSRKVEEPLSQNEFLQKQKNIQRPCLEPEELMYRKRWLAADLDPKDVSNEMELSIESAQKLLQNIASLYQKG
jgi:hypothetical protein